MYSNKLYRSNEYCEIPKCDQEYTTQNERLIYTTEEKLSCGCLAFEYRSHLPICRFWNTNEDQPYYPGCLD